MEIEIDIQRLIYEVKIRPDLWDKEHPSYKKKKSERLPVWMELVHILCPLVKSGRDLQLADYLEKKWTNLKDSYMRKHKMQCGLPSNSKDKKKHKYLYHDEISFLNKIIKHRPACSKFQENNFSDIYFDRHPNKTGTYKNKTSFFDEILTFVKYLNTNELETLEHLIKNIKNSTPTYEIPVEHYGTSASLENIQGFKLIENDPKITGNTLLDFHHNSLENVNISVAERLSIESPALFSEESLSSLLIQESDIPRNFQSNDFDLNGMPEGTFSMSNLTNVEFTTLPTIRTSSIETEQFLSHGTSNSEISEFINNYDPF